MHLLLLLVLLMMYGFLEIKKTIFKGSSMEKRFGYNGIELTKFQTAHFTKLNTMSRLNCAITLQISNFTV